MLLLSFIFPLVLIVFTDPEVAPIYVGFFGLSLFALGFAAVGIAVSAFTRSQVVAGVISLVLLLLLFVIDAPAGKLGPGAKDLLEYLSPANQAQPFFKGVIEGQGLVYFLSLITLGIFISCRAIEGERWR